MGVDATLFVLATYTGVGCRFVQHVFDLERDSDLWGKINTVPAGRPLRSVQLPCSSWVAYSDGYRPGGARADSESGYLFKDCYGNKLAPRTGSELAAIHSDNDFNNAVLDFIGTHFGGRDVVVFWH